MLSKYFADPCGPEGTCLVKMTCTLIKEYPWSRRSKCPDYKKYKRRDAMKEKIIDISATIFFGGIVLVIGGFILFSLAVGAYTNAKYIIDWIF